MYIYIYVYMYICIYIYISMMYTNPYKYNSRLQPTSCVWLCTGGASFGPLQHLCLRGRCDTINWYRWGSFVV